MQLRWNDHTDSTINGDWSINSEHVRGEPRWYWADGMPTGAASVIEELGLEMGSYSKATVKRRCQRVQDMLDARADGIAR